MKLVRAFRAMSILVVLALAASGMVACGSTPTSPSTPPYSQVDLKVGEGSPAAVGQNVTVNYTGWLYDASKTDSKGAQFDTTTGRQPFIFTLGGNQVIAGWDKGVVGMQVGGIRRLVIPPSLAYGSARNGPIPPNATLVFEIEVVSIDQVTQ